jgi:hypothetical protein
MLCPIPDETPVIKAAFFSDIFCILLSFKRVFEGNPFLEDWSRGTQHVIIRRSTKIEREIV